MKTHKRKSKASGSTRRKVDRLIRLGWAPGKKLFAEKVRQNELAA